MTDPTAQTASDVSDAPAVAPTKPDVPENPAKTDDIPAPPPASDAPVPDAPSSDAPPSDKPVSDAPATDAPATTDPPVPAEGATDPKSSADTPMTPESDLSRSIAKELGKEISELFRRGEAQAKAAEADVNRLQDATGTFVEALQAVPEENQNTVSFAEIALLYGRTLIRFIEESGSGSAKLVNKVVKAAVAGVTGAALADDDGASADKPDESKTDKVDDKAVKDEEKKSGESPAEKTEVKPDAKSDEMVEKVEKSEVNGEAKTKTDDDDEEDLDDTKDEDEDSELAWANIETARIIFEREKMTQRLAFCRATLGELMLVCDEGKQAAEEFQSASDLYEDRRQRAECLYKRYLALRMEEKVEAARALRSAVDVYAGLDDDDRDESVLTDMRNELKEMEQTVAEAERSTNKDEEITVVAVQPKRKRDAAKTDAPAATIKKPRVEEPAGR